MSYKSLGLVNTSLLFTYNQFFSLFQSPRIESIKVHDPYPKDNSIIIDLEILYAGDCEMTFTVVTALPNLDGVIKVFDVSGILRIIVNPQTGETKLAFVNYPDINYTLDGLIGIGLDTIRENIERAIEDTIVLPNTVSFNLSPPTTPVPVAQEAFETPHTTQPTRTTSSNTATTPKCTAAKSGSDTNSSSNSKTSPASDNQKNDGKMPIEWPVENEFQWQVLGIVAGYIWSKTDVSMIIYVALVVLIVAHHTYRMKSRVEITRSRRRISSHETQAIHDRLRLSDPPAWVSFPDWERCEWINKIVKHMWLRGCDYTNTYVKELIEYYVVEGLYTDFKLDHYDLGYVPLRVEGAKVYKPTVNTKMSKDEIIIDLDVSYFGDNELSFKLSGATCTVRNIQIQGLLRLVLKHVSVQPLIISLEIYFINKPTIDFILDGIASPLNLPGVKNIIRRVVTNQVTELMVLPQKLTLELINYEAKHLQDFSWYVQLRR